MDWDLFSNEMLKARAKVAVVEASLSPDEFTLYLEAREDAERAVLGEGATWGLPS